MNDRQPGALLDAVDAAPRPSLFRSFWQAGFESASHVNRQGVRVDMLARTQHDRLVREDFARLREVGIRVAREGVRWHLVDRAGHFDFSTVRPVVEAAREHDIQLLWNLCHYGSPDGVDLFSPRFVDRFARYARALATFIRDSSDEVPFYSPINEVSFLSWGAGHVGYIYPYGKERGTELKRNLVRAIIAGIEAIWSVDQRARILHCDPIIEVIAPNDRPELARPAADMTESQFEAWDMIAGGFHGDLGGQARYLDVMGANYYFSNQWEFPATPISWDQGEEDPRRAPLSNLLERLYRRYHRPLFISETSHIGDGRARWVSEVAEQVVVARGRGIPVEGVCLYPIIDRPDWDDPNHWHHSGLWDLRDEGGRLERQLCRDYADRLHLVRQALRAGGCG
jgi:hypothetical protein